MILIRRRLFWKIYLTLLSSLVAVATLMGVFWWLMRDRGLDENVFRVDLSDQAAMERNGATGNELDAILGAGDNFGSGVALYDGDGALIASRGRPIALSEGQGGEPAPRRGPIVRIDLPDGRVLLARPRPPGRDPRVRILSIVLIVAAGVGLAAFPMTARLTRELEALRSGVEQWGAGALSLRVDHAGDDEVAVVARAFNVAAQRVEALLTSQKLLLANASHELRSPLARLRMAVELWLDRPAPGIQAEIVRNLDEIDQLVGEILLASRLDHGARIVSRAETVDLLGLAAEEAARVDATVADAAGADAIEVGGDRALLRRLIRNLLENAVKHGRPPIRIAVTRHDGKARIVVSDQGNGIDPSERARVFEPFYRPAGRGELSGGWGLGLSLVRQIAARHGGAVACEAEAGGGSRFVVDLAMETDSPPEGTRAPDG